MASNGDRFEGAYDKIDALLRKRIGGTKILSFSSVVTEAARKDPTVYRNKEDLLEYGVHRFKRLLFFLAFLSHFHFRSRSAAWEPLPISS